MNRNTGFQLGYPEQRLPPIKQKSESTTFQFIWDTSMRLAAFVCLLCLLPFFALIWICMQLTDRGPMFFKQSRPGYKGQTFTIFKIRTMRQGAEKSTALGTQNSSSEITTLGKVLRTLKIDEAPQLLNIIKGDMVIVGPRPIPEALDTNLRANIPGFETRYTVKPGLTSIGQICVTDNALGDALIRDWKLRFEGELHYIRNKSVSYDLVMIGMTIAFVFKKLSKSDQSETHNSVHRTTQINGIQLTNSNYETACARILGWAMRNEHRYVCICNVHSVTASRWDSGLKASLTSSDLNTADGMPLVWLQRKLGHPTASRVYGPTLMFELIERAVTKNARIALYGGHPDRMPKLIENLKANFPSIQIVATVIPPFRPLTAIEDKKFTEEIAQARPNITFVGIGCPKQENWMRLHRARIPGVLLGVGAAFDFHADAVKQAPAFIQNAGMEWAFRLAMEPKRLFRRYLTTNTVFIATATLQLLKSKIGRTNYQSNYNPTVFLKKEKTDTKTWAICIATYKRPEQLKKLLESINATERPSNIDLELRIVDNDQNASAQETVKNFTKGAHEFTTITYKIDPRQNIAHARNSAIDMGNADSYLFVDDDEFVSPEWLIAFANSEQSIPTAAAHFGPVIGILEKAAPSWAKKGQFFDKLVHTTGTPITWKETRTSNTLVQSKWFEEKGFRFDPELGRSGGSDSDLFARMSVTGAEYTTCQEAKVSELVPKDRAKFSWLWQRAYRNGLIYERNINHTSNKCHPLIRACKRSLSIPYLTLSGLPGLFKGNSTKTAFGLLKLPLLFGGLKAYIKPSSTTKHVAYNGSVQKVAMLTNIVSPYRKPVFESLAQTPGWEFRLFADAQTEFDRSWQVDLDTLPIENTYCLSWTRKTRTAGPIKYDQKLTLHIPYGLLFQLPRFRPEIVISLELGFRTAFAALYTKITGSDLVIWSYQSKISARQSWLRKKWRTLLLNQASAVVGMGSQARQVLIDWGVPKFKIQNAPNAANHDCLADRLSEKEAEVRIRTIKQKFADHKKLAIVVGRLIPLKGIEQMLETWKRLPQPIRNQWKLIFVGEGPLNQLFESENSNEIELAGAVPPDCIADWYTAADLHIFPSCGDVWGLVVNEASACGTPTLCSVHAGCCDDLISEGKNGFKIDLSISESADLKLHKVLLNEHLNQIGLAAQKKISQYTIERMANGFRSALPSLAKP